MEAGAAQALNAEERIYLTGAGLGFCFWLGQAGLIGVQFCIWLSEKLFPYWWGWFCSFSVLQIFCAMIVAGLLACGGVLVWIIWLLHD